MKINNPLYKEQIEDLSASIVWNSTYVDTSKQLEKTVIRCGNVATISLTFYALVAIPSGQPVVSGLPKAAGHSSSAYRQKAAEPLPGQSPLREPSKSSTLARLRQAHYGELATHIFVNKERKMIRYYGRGGNI